MSMQLLNNIYMFSSIIIKMIELSILITAEFVVNNYINKLINIFFFLIIKEYLFRFKMKSTGFLFLNIFINVYRESKLTNKATEKIKVL